MPTVAILLLLVSAALHTAWNVLLKQVGEKYIATWWVIAFGGLLSLVGLLWSGLPNPELWPFVAASVCVEVSYFLMLARGYSQHDFTLVYPIGRGAAPAMAALWALLFLHEQPSAGGLAGLVLIIAGLLFIGARRGDAPAARRLHASGVATALAVALLVSTYTVIDGAAVKQGAVAPYALAVFALMPLPAAPIVLRRYDWPRLKGTLSAERLRIPLVSVLGIGSYLLALAAYSIAPLNYSAAIRESSVVMGAFVGWRYLGEKMGGARLAGAAVVFAGILLIALLG